MQIKSLELLIKHKKIELDELSTKLMAKNEELSHLANQKKELQNRLDNIEQDPVENVAKALWLQAYTSELFSNIANIDEEMQLLLKEIENIKSKLKEAFGQKEGLEKMLKRLKNQIKEKEIIQESRLADESFMRNFTAR